MSAADVVLAIDLGTGGPKVALVTFGGEILGSAHRRVEPVVAADGTALQDPGAWWDAVVAGTQELVGADAAAAARTVAIAVTGQWGSTVPVDAAGEAVGDCMLWMDTRARDHARSVLGGTVSVEGFAPRTILEFIRRTGGAPSTEGNDPLGHRLWIEREEPEVHRATATFLEPIDYLNARFTGRVCASQASMLLSWLTDNRVLGAAAYDPVLVRLAAADPNRLPELVPTGTVIGTVLPAVADELGLPADLPVVTALPDLLAAALGTGSIESYAAHVSVSTSGWVGCHAPKKKTSIAKQMATVPSALPDRYVLANNHETAGVCLEWLRNGLVTADDGLGPGRAVGFDELTAVAATSSAGAGGVLFMPWLNGERSPIADVDLRASFLNIGLATTRADLIRALLEGVAHNSRWLLEASEKVLRHPFHDLRIIGGGAQSDLWCQLHADIIGRPLARVADPLLANLRGVAFFAGMALGRLTVADLEGRVPVDQRFEPDPSARAVHDAHFAEFTKVHKAQHGMYQRLNG